MADPLQVLLNQLKKRRDFKDKYPFAPVPDFSPASDSRTTLQELEKQLKPKPGLNDLLAGVSSSDVPKTMGGERLRNPAWMFPEWKGKLTQEQMQIREAKYPELYRRAKPYSEMGAMERSQARIREEMANSPNPVARAVASPIGEVATAVVGAGLLAYGAYQTLDAAYSGLTNFATKLAFQKMAAQRGGQLTKEEVRAAQNWAANFTRNSILKADANTLFKRTPKGYQPTDYAVKVVDDTTTKAIAEWNPRLAPTFTQGGSAVPGQTRPLADIMAGAKMKLGEPTPESIAFKIAQGKVLSKAEEQLRVDNPQAVETVLNQLKETSTPKAEVTLAPEVTRRITRTTKQQDIQETAKILSSKLKESGIPESDIPDLLGVYNISETATETRASLTFEQLRNLTDKGITEDNVRKLTREILAKEFGVPSHEVDLILEGGSRVNPRLDIQQAEIKAREIDNLIKRSLPTRKDILASINKAIPKAKVEPAVTATPVAPTTPRFLNTPISKSKLASLVKIEALRAKSNMDSSTRTRDEWESEFIAAAKQAAYEELNEAEGLTFPASRFDDPTFSESPEMSRVRGYPPQAIQNYLRWEHLWDEGLNKFNADVYSIHSESVGNIPYTPGYLGDRSQAASKIPFWSGTLADTTGTGVPATPVTPEAATPMPSPTAQAGQAKPGMPKVSSASISKLLEDVKVIILKPGMPGYRELKVKSGGGNYDVKTNTIVIADRFENVGVHEAGHVFWGKFGTDEANKIFQAEFARFNPKVKHAILESTRKGAAGRYAKEWKEVNPKGVVTPERLEGYMDIARASITMKDVADEVKADIFKKVAQGKGHPKFPKTTALIEENLAGLVTPTEPAGVAPKPAVELPPKITVTHITNAKGGEFVIEPIKITNDEFGLFLEPDRVTFAGIAVKPSGGLWAAPGNTWEGFLKRGKLQERLKNTTAKVTLEVDTKNVVVIDSVEDAKNKLTWKKGIRHPVVDFAALKKSGVTGVYLTQRGETQTRRHPKYPLIGWDIESLLILDEKIATIKSIEKVVEPQSPTPVLQESNPQQPKISETPKVTTTIPPVKSATEPPIEEPPVGLGVSEILPDPQNSKYWFPEPPRDIKKFVEFSKKSAPGSFSKKEGVFDTIEQANQLHLLARYMGKNADQLAQSYISAGGNTEKAFSLLDNQIATNVLNPEGRSLAIGDILSNPAHYDLNPEQADLAKRYGFLYSEALKLAKSYGVKINELPGLDEFSQFIARRVIGKTNKVTGAVDYPPGSIGGFKLGAKIGSQKARVFEEMTQGIELGLSYDSPENALSVYIQGIYRLIGNKQAELLIKPLTRPITKGKPVVFGESRIYQPALEDRAASVAIAQAIDKVFAVQGENKILKIIAEISGALTGQVTAMDVSAPPLQGLVLLGHDIKSNMQGKPSALWAKSYANMWRIMANPQYIIRFRQNNQELYKRYVEHLGRVLHSEFVSGVPTTEKALLNIPIIGKPTSWAYKNTWGRTAASYSGFIEMGTIRLYQQLEPAWVRSQQNLYDLGSMSVRMLGATTKLGMNPNQAHAERTATIAPNYIRASLLIMKDLISRGAAAREVRDSILALIATGVLFYYAEEKLRGREPKMKPWGKRFGGDGAEAFTTEIYGQRVGLGGFLYGLIRLGADLTAMSVDDPSALVVWNNQHPLNKFLTNKRGIAVGLAVDLATGKNFFGQSFDSVDDYLWRTMESVTPISAQSQVIPSQKGKPIQGALEFTGLRVFPYSLQSQWKDEGKFLEYYDIPAKPIDQELKGTMSREQYRERHPDVDARLFITKETSSVATVAGANQAIQIANRENIDLLALPEVMRRVNTIHEREKLGLPRKTPNSPTDILVEHLLGGNNKPSMQSPRNIAPAGQKQSKELSPELKSKLGIK